MSLFFPKSYQRSLPIKKILKSWKVQRPLETSEVTFQQYLKASGNLKKVLKVLVNLLRSLNICGRFSVVFRGQNYSKGLWHFFGKFMALPSDSQRFWLLWLSGRALVETSVKFLVVLKSLWFSKSFQTFKTILNKSWKVQDYMSH